MANELAVIDDGSGKKLCTLDLASIEGKMKALEIIGGTSEAGKDWLPTNKKTELAIAHVVIQRTEEFLREDGEMIPAGWRATCVLDDGQLVHFSSYRVVQYLKACLAMWGGNWKGLVLAFTKSNANGKTSYKVEYVAEME